MAAHEQVLERQDARDKALIERVESHLKALRTQVADSGKQETELRQQIKDGQAEVVKAAKQLDVTREELEKRAGAAITTMVEAQAKAKEAVVNGTETALKKLMDKSDPASAPSLITGVMDKAAADMRETTNKNISGLVKDLSAQFGESSPLVERIAKLVREGAEAEIKRVEEQVEKLRSDSSRTGPARSTARTSAARATKTTSWSSSARALASMAGRSAARASRPVTPPAPRKAITS